MTSRIANLLLSWLLFASLYAAPEPVRPNVVILLSDDQGTLDANCYGSTDLITPNIDKLAATGVRFTQAYAHTVCCPARAALLTGRHPQRGGVTDWTQGDMNRPKGVNMALEEVTLAEVLKGAGYPMGHPYGASGAGNTGKWIGQKATFLEGGIRVPAIVSYPGTLPQGQVRDQIITAMDWFPTVSELCQLEPKPDAPALDGHSLLPIIKSADAESPYRGVLHFAWRGSWAVRDGDWKLISMIQRGATKSIVSLHSLAGEHPEVVDYFKEEPEIVARLQALHDQWVKEVK